MEASHTNQPASYTLPLGGQSDAANRCVVFVLRRSVQQHSDQTRQGNRKNGNEVTACKHLEFRRSYLMRWVSYIANSSEVSPNPPIYPR